MYAQDDSYYDEGYLRLANHSYAQNIKTVMMHPQGAPLASPIHTLNASKPLELHFDVLDSELGNYMYTLIHCDYNWEQSDLDFQEYIDGPFEDFINEYEYSRNTYQRFIQYKVEIPNFNMRITKSGNYVIKVFQEGNQDSLVLTRRFSVVEANSAVNIKANIHQATSVKQRYSHQEVDFSIITGGYQLTNPYTDLKVIVLQNHTWESAMIGLEPRFVKNDQLDYDYDGENAFLGLNEFRLFDIKDTRFTGQGIERVSSIDKENHAHLQLDKSKSSKTYLQRPDINGWFFIKNDRLGSENHADADYVRVHFSLKQSKPLGTGNLYIFGALTDWKIKSEAKLLYNAESEEYRCDLYLKQGLYNYMYVMANDGSSSVESIDMGFVSGSHFETENDYTILVYHRPLGLDYDKLISAFETKYSNN